MSRGQFGVASRTHVTRRPRRWVIANEMISDAADVQRVLSGDVDAFARLVDRYYERCARFAVRMLKYCSAKDPA